MSRQGRGIGRLVGLSIVLGIGVLATTAVRLRSADADHAATPRVLGATVTQVAVAPPAQYLPPTKLNDSTPPVQAKAVYLLDVASAYPLYAEHEREAVPIASVTKLMTAVVTRQQYALDEVVTVSKEAATINGSVIQLRTGETITVEALLTGLLIQSGNDAAQALAEHRGSAEAFIAAMNEQAAYLGMTDTVFKDPAGLNDEGRSTARDLGILASYVLRDSTIRSIVQTAATSIQSTDGRFTHQLESSNRLIKTEHPLYMAQVTGLKTGFTPDAGHCLVASATHQGNEVVSVVLHTALSTTEASAAETKKLFSWAFQNYAWQQPDHN